LEKNICKHKISNKSDLKATLIEEWEKITPEVTKKLVKSIPKRLKLVVNQKGGHTKY